MRLSTWLTALCLIVAVSAVGLATTAAAAGPQATAAKKKGCKKGYVKKKTAKGTKCVKTKAAPKKKVSGNAKLPADGQYRLSGSDIYVSGKQTSILIRATIPTTEMQCQSGTPSRSSGLVSLTLPLSANGTFNGTSTTNGPAAASGQFSDATHLTMTVNASDVQGGNSATDLCSGTKTITGVLTKK